MTSSEVFSAPADIRFSLRWLAIVSAVVEQMHLAGSTGVHDGQGLVKMILAGARAVQVCSAIYKKGPEIITSMLDELDQWMETKGFAQPDAFRGSMNYKNLPEPQVYERSQFMKYFSSHH
jgi:dihydroorotate dehydrogenase (fumarate)